MCLLDSKTAHKLKIRSSSCFCSGSTALIHSQRGAHGGRFATNLFIIQRVFCCVLILSSSVRDLFGFRSLIYLVSGPAKIEVTGNQYRLPKKIIFSICFPLFFSKIILYYKGEKTDLLEQTYKCCFMTLYSSLFKLGEGEGYQ